MRSHLINTWWNATSFKHYDGGNLGVADMGALLAPRGGGGTSPSRHKMSPGQEESENENRIPLSNSDVRNR